tara:strand:+ start:1047 stop:1214 length:168 start_codon:yes stop_codon:yes gene_type:complete
MKKHKKEWFVGVCKFCKKDLLNTDSFVSFADRKSAHYDCLIKDDEMQKNLLLKSC